MFTVLRKSRSVKVNNKWIVIAGRYRYLIAVVIIAGSYAAILSERTMPFAEGWYTYYAQCINHGEIVYKDFDYLFPPFYIYTIALITKIFGYKIIVLRVVGVVFFGLIAGILFLIFRELFQEAYACVGAVTAVFFLQSEVVQIFYDYIRFMDIFACLTVFLLVRAVKTLHKRYYCLYLFLAGMSNALFCLVKQNMGLVFAAFAVLLICAVNIVCRTGFRRCLKSLALFLDGLAVPIFLACAVMLFNGSFGYFIRMTGADAVSAKGGIAAILFGWLKNNIASFKNGLGFAMLLLVILPALWMLGKMLSKKDRNLNRGGVKRFDLITTLLFCVSVLLYIVCSAKYSILSGIAKPPYLSPYSVFLTATVLLFAFTAHVIFRFVKHQKISGRELLYITVLGSYFAISYGCGMSAGLAEGQAAVGTAFLIAFLLHCAEFRFGQAAKGLILLICFLITVQSAQKKMLYTYNWWGMDEADFWSSSMTSDKIALLDGIRMSPETLEAYETIYDVITGTTDENDTIYCFPQVPVFYSICDRTDPGVRAKVQWFDVASDASIRADIEVITENPPKAILIYETSEYAYQSHERLFRSGGISATRMMKNFLINFAQTHGYLFYGRITASDQNHFLLYYKENDDFSYIGGFAGEGTREEPYLIQSADDLWMLSRRVADGNDFAGSYFKQTADLDLTGMDNWTPIGRYDSGFYFKGIYDGGGHIIRNLQCKEKDGNVGLFGQLGGIVCNLGVVDSEVIGSCVGVITSHGVDENAMILNCYTDSSAEGAFRAGSLADNFSGTVYNCFSLGETHAMEMAGAVSYYEGTIENVFALDETIVSEIVDNRGNDDVIYVTKAYMESENLLDSLNQSVSETEHCKRHYKESGQSYDEETGLTYADWMDKVDLRYWRYDKKQGYPVLQ